MAVAAGLAIGASDVPAAAATTHSATAKVRTAPATAPSTTSTGTVHQLDWWW